MADTDAKTTGPLIQTDTSKTMPSPLELQRRYLELQTADVNGALSQMQEETQLLDLRIKPLRRGMRCAGLAVTWHAVLTNHEPVPMKEAPYNGWVKVWEHIYPGCILCAPAPLRETRCFRHTGRTICTSASH